jgi:hypothetical protein
MLYGGTAFLGFLHGRDEKEAPALEDPRRKQAIAAVDGLFNGFLEGFGATECRTLTKCDHSIPAEVERFHKEELYNDACVPQFRYILSYCLEQIEAATKK